MNQNPTELNFKKLGSGPNLIILHGLFGSLDNWQTVANHLSEIFTVFLLDLRNHGRSPHSNEMNYQLMARDLSHFIRKHQLENVNLCGHSMGGKVVLQCLMESPELYQKAMVVDIGLKAYPAGHDQIFEALFSLPIHELNSRQEADLELSKKITQPEVRQFLLKNLERKSVAGFQWKFNLKGIFQNYHEISSEINIPNKILHPVLFVLGARSNYVLEEDKAEITKQLALAKFHTIPNAGHWVHADQPLIMIECIKSWFKNE